MARYVLRPLTLTDLDENWDYSVAQWDEAQAERYVRGILAAAQVVPEHPKRGLSCDEVRKGYRLYIVGSHVIFYKELLEGIEIVRILHGRMKVARHL